jgi:hypothetical protein
VTGAGGYGEADGWVSEGEDGRAKGLADVAVIADTSVTGEKIFAIAVIAVMSVTGEKIFAIAVIVVIAVTGSSAFVVTNVIFVVIVVTTWVAIEIPRLV